MKKMITIIMALVIIFSLAACGSKTNDSGSSEVTKQDENTLKAEKKILSVEVTIPAEMLDDSSDEALDEKAKEAGVKEIKKNDDGSITMKMSKSAHKKMLEEFKGSIDNAINETLEDKENYPSFDSITYNDDLTEFNINVDPNLYGGFESFASLTYYFAGNYYQALNAVPSEDLQTIVNFVNKDTGEVIESGNSKDLGDEEVENAN